MSVLLRFNFNPTDSSPNSFDRNSVEKDEKEMKTVALRRFSLPNTVMCNEHPACYFQSFDNPTKMSLCSFLSPHDLEALKLTSKANKSLMEKWEPDLEGTLRNIQLLLGISPNMEDKHLKVLLPKVLDKIYDSLLLLSHFYIQIVVCVCERVDAIENFVQQLQEKQKKDYDSAVSGMRAETAAGRDPTLSASFEFSNRDSLDQKIETSKKFLDYLLQYRPVFQQHLDILNSIKEDLTKLRDVRDVKQKYKQLQEIYIRLVTPANAPKVRERINKKVSLEDVSKTVFDNSGDDKQSIDKKLTNGINLTISEHSCYSSAEAADTGLVGTFTNFYMLVKGLLEKWHTLTNYDLLDKLQIYKDHLQLILSLARNGNEDFSRLPSLSIFGQMSELTKQLKQQASVKADSQTWELDPAYYASYWFCERYSRDYLFKSKDHLFKSRDLFNSRGLFERLPNYIESAFIINTAQAFNWRGIYENDPYRVDKLKRRIHILKECADELQQKQTESQKVQTVQKIKILIRCFSIKDIIEFIDPRIKYRIPGLFVKLVISMKVVEMDHELCNFVKAKFPFPYPEIGYSIEEDLNSILTMISLIRSRLSDAKRQEFDKIICVEWMCTHLHSLADRLLNSFPYGSFSRRAFSSQEQQECWRTIGSWFLAYRSKLNQVERLQFDAIASKKIITTEAYMAGYASWVDCCDGEQFCCYSESRDYAYEKKYRKMSYADAISMTGSSCPRALACCMMVRC